tara:strand:+ start:328 stop:2694 length:2367 start_codon:yes stop_codon:yes gene_type:complete
MKKVLVKAALPTLAESGHGWDDITALRWIPARHEKTFSKPIPLHYNHGNIDWETMRMNEKNVADSPNHVWAERTPLPHWQDPRTTGTFVAPPTQQGIPRDTQIGPAVDSTLLGLIGEQGKPNFWRTPRQGAQIGSAGEGFQYGGYDPSAFVKIPTSQTFTPFKYDKYQRLLENPTGYAGWASRPAGQFTQSFIDEAENLKHQFPDVPTRDIWGPSTLEINPLMEGFHPDDYKVAGEPMNLAWRLLKAQQTLDAYHPEYIEEGFEPNVQNIIIASKPGAEEITAEEQSRSHDEMLRRISELEGAEGIRIISARGRSSQWGDENSFMLTNVPDDMMPHIHSLAGEFGQDSILHSPKGMAGTQFVNSEGEVTGGLEEGEFTEGTPPNYTEFPMGQKYAYGNYVAVNKGQEYHPSVGGYLEDAQTMVTNSGNVIPRLESSYRMDPENPGGEIAIQPPVQEQPEQEEVVQQQTYDGRPMPEKRIELGSSFWDDMVHRGGEHNRWPRITPKEKEEVKERVTTAMQGLINPDGSWNDWAMKNLKHDAGQGGGPSIAIRTHLFGPDGHRRSPMENDPSNGDSIIAIVNRHRERGKNVPGFRTIMFRNSEYNAPHISQPFKPDGDLQHQRDRLGVQNVIDHAPELDDNNQRVSLHGVPGRKRKEWRRRGRGDRRRKGYPVYVLNQLGDVLVKERVSPEAKQHKLEYDTAYQATPERRKYRADLNRERRRRGMYGDHSGRDISHTEGGKLTVEDAHENRARHFKNQGTLRHVGVKKKANDERKANLVSVVPPLKGENE